MTAIHQTSLFIFRQDLRVHDNKWLLQAIRESENVIPIFIFDKNILASFPKPNKVIGFLVDAVKFLQKELEKRWSYLAIFYGDSIEIITDLVKKHTINAIYQNESYGYNSVTRDVHIQQLCKKQWIVYNAVHDYMIVPIDAVPARKVFTPFYKLRQKYIDINPTLTTIDKAPSTITSPSIHYSPRTDIEDKLGAEKNNQWHIHFAQNRLNRFNFATYNDTRNFPYIDGSSRLSAYSRFGLISIRELYNTAKKQWWETYISELAWREFWQHIFYNFPESRTLEFQEKRRNITRDNNDSFFEARKNGMTWYPLVDAGMRQLKAENRIHNRVRMVVASFLTKDLLIDWRWWEKHFADYLIDYDTNVNIWNRQWSASVWADPKPLRIFSPMLQSERFDPYCIYIKKWIPELQHYSPKEIHNPLEYDLWYAKPIVNHYEWSKKAKERYMNIV